MNYCLILITCQAEGLLNSLTVFEAVSASISAKPLILYRFLGLGKLYLLPTFVCENRGLRSVEPCILQRILSKGKQLMNFLCTLQGGHFGTPEQLITAVLALGHTRIAFCLGFALLIALAAAHLWGNMQSILRLDCLARPTELEEASH